MTATTTACAIIRGRLNDGGAVLRLGDDVGYKRQQSSGSTAIGDASHVLYYLVAILHLLMSLIDKFMMCLGCSGYR
jgi:hypothetical protein